MKKSTIKISKSSQKAKKKDSKDDIFCWEEGTPHYFADSLLLTEYLTSQKKVQKGRKSENDLNDLTGKEWTIRAKSVQLYNSAITEKRKLHGAAFPLSLAKHFIEIYSKEGDTILDPFAGVGTTLDSANILKRHAVGIELNKKYIDLFNLGIDPKDGKVNSDYKRIMIQDSATNIKRHLTEESIHLIVTSPPYANLLNNIRERFADKDYNGNTYKNQSRKLAKPYSENELDLGNLSYSSYLERIGSLFEMLYAIAKPGSYNVWVVRDYRNFNQMIPYIPLHIDIVKKATEKRWVLWDMVIWDQSNQRKLVRLGGNKSRRYYFNIGHSFILIFRKNMNGEEFN